MNPVEEILKDFLPELGSAAQPYLNHATRVFFLAKKLDSDNSLNDEKLAIACAFHDLGIWMENTWNYLEPSEKLCSNYLDSIAKSAWTDEILTMIAQHHKLLPYHGTFETSVELFRKADLIDFSGGLIRFGISKEEYRQLTGQFPFLAFHGILFKSFKHHFMKKPWNPFPMVKL